MGERARNRANLDFTMQWRLIVSAHLSLVAIQDARVTEVASLMETGQLLDILVSSELKSSTFSPMTM
eukprot:3831478-Ditylum_brightwellii.AAC.1